MLTDYPDNFPKPIKTTLLIADELYLLFQKDPNITRINFLKSIKKICSKHNRNNIPLWALSYVYFNQKKLTNNLKNLLMIKNIRSQSGIVPVSIFTANFGCPGKCVYCPQEARIPKSYFSDEPAVMRAIRNNYDAYDQVISRLTQLFFSGHSLDKVELIIQGGTFSSMSKKYREYFVKRAFDGANNYTCPTLEKSQKRNEKAKRRIIGITIETRPDWCTEKEISFLRKLGVTRVELGVQSLQDKVLKLVKRGHTNIDVKKATKLLKDAGFKVCYHMMPGLPGATLESDIADIKELFNNEDYQPDLLKIYPCQVVRDSELLNWYKEGKYQPYNDEKLTKLIMEIKKAIPPYVRISRLVRDIPSVDIIAGSRISNLRQIVQKKVKCRCIRCREVALDIQLPVILRETKYKASDGMEYFLEYIESKTEKLYALLRLRFTSKGDAIIRELHTYGLAIPVGKNTKSHPQHTGLGQNLLKIADEIAKRNKVIKLFVISGVGVREYYRKFGYKLEGTYMVKDL